MASTIWIKVVGFSDVERHSLNTLIRLSDRMVPTFALWTPDAPSPPQVALIDLESYEGSLELASPRFNVNMKVICVGAKAPAGTWRTFARPVNWRELSDVLSALFVAPTEIDFDITGEEPEKVTPAGVKIALMVGMSREERLYLRARLALAGITEVDETETRLLALELAAKRSYGLALVDLHLPAEDSWELIQSLYALDAPVRSIIATSSTPSWPVLEKVEQLGCVALLEIPFLPRQVMQALAKV